MPVSPGEQAMKDMLDRMLVGFEVLENYRPKWMTNYKTTTARLEFDRFYPELNIGFEYQGRQHSKKSAISDSAQIARDEIKQEICKVRGVTLVCKWCQEGDDHFRNREALTAMLIRGWHLILRTRRCRSGFAN